MTPNAIKIAIAKALGWTAHRDPKRAKCGIDIPVCEAYLWEHVFVPPQFKGDTAYHRQLPDWPRDLNACHEMEASLSWEEGHIMNELLYDSMPEDQHLYHATALQRCEMFLKTKVLWVWPALVSV